MQNEEVSEFEKIKRQLVKLKRQLTTNTLTNTFLQLLIFALLMNVVSDTVRKDSKDWKQDYRVGYYSSNEQKMIDNLEQKMLLELKKIQDQITELKVQE